MPFYTFSVLGVSISLPLDLRCSCHFLRLTRCFSAQASHRLCCGIAWFEQSLHRPSSFASRRCSFARRRTRSRRSAVFPLFCSRSGSSSRLDSTPAAFGSVRGFACLGVAFRGVMLVEDFRGVFPACFALLGGRPPALAGSGNAMANSNVRPTAHSCGGTGMSGKPRRHRLGLSPRLRGKCGSPVFRRLERGTIGLFSVSRSPSKDLHSSVPRKAGWRRRSAVGPGWLPRRP